jgi:hypothetical protein
MEHIRRWQVLILVLAALPLAACQGGSEEEEEGGDEPARIVPVEGSDTSRVILTAQAAERLGIQTAPVRDVAGGTVIPYSAVVYDPDGKTWAYANPEPLTFLRSAITVDRITGDEAFLLEGPPPGTAVVTIGAVELYGAELGIE